MIKIGITAGIGAGKTTVCKVFSEEFLVPVYDMDSRAKALVEEVPDLKQELVEHFGPETLNEDGSYNPKHVASIVFKDKEEKKWLEHTIGGYMKEDYITWCKNNKKKKFPFSIIESAILFEAKCDEWVDFVIGVECPVPIRIERVQKRNNFTTEQVLERIHNQMPDDEKLGLCDFIITNDGTAELRPQVLGIYRILTKIYQIERRSSKMGAQGVAYGLGVSGIGETPDGQFDEKVIMPIITSFLDKYDQ